MLLTTLLPLIAAGFSIALALIILRQDRRAAVHWFFALGMVVFGAEAVLNALSASADYGPELLYWQQLRLTAAAFLPGLWLLFSVSFARADYARWLRRWQWLLIIALALPALVILAPRFGEPLFADIFLDAGSGWQLRFGHSTYLFSLLFMLSAVLIVMNLERTLQVSSGEMRWQIKFMVLGLAGLFAVRIYTSSQALIYPFVDLSLQSLNAGALLIADLLILVSIWRGRVLNQRVYLSPTFIYGSITVIFAGLYLLAIGVTAALAPYFGGSHSFALGAFLVFAGLLGLAVILLSDSLRQHMKRFVSRHLQRPRHDYRRQWTAFTRRTASLMTPAELCQAVTKMAAETFGCSSATIWLADQSGENLTLGASTAFSAEERAALQPYGKDLSALGRSMQEQAEPVTFDVSGPEWALALKEAHRDGFSAARIRYCVALSANNEFLGL